MIMNYEDAERRLKIFERGRGGALVQLASHAALPVVLNADFVHLLRVNYFLDPPVTLPYTAEAELLLSPLCTEVDQGLYVIDPELRDVLLRRLIKEYGSGRLRDIARLLWEYGQRSTPWFDRPGLSEAQQLTALNFIDPARAQDWLTRAEERADAGTAVDERWFVAMRQDLEDRAVAVHRAQEQTASTPDKSAAEIDLPSTAPVPLANRVVEVIADLGDEATPRYRYGSGCIVRGRTVLTSAHVVADAQAVLVRRSDAVLWPAGIDRRFVGGGAGPDLALVDIYTDTINLEPIALAVVDRDSPEAEPAAARALGHPRFAGEPSLSAVQDTVVVMGHIPVLSNLAVGLLTVQLTSSPRPLPPESVTLGESEWSGMSGAPVVADECLLGVVSELAAREGSAAITAVPLSALEADPAHPGWGAGVSNASEWWARLGVTGPAGLRRLSARGERPKSAYWATVEEIHRRTPPLIDRVKELAALITFATGTQGYRWLQGGAGVGKTALVAESVTTTLPPSVNVVAYFLSRHLDDADSSHFLASVVPQLAHLLGRTPPASDRYEFHALWASAAERATATGRHLLLVVDGLDEDLLPPGLPSVASLLPADVGGNSHVLVTSRTNSGLPRDVPPQHPLQQIEPVPLDPPERLLDLAGPALEKLQDALEALQRAMRAMVQVEQRSTVPAEMDDWDFRDQEATHQELAALVTGPAAELESYSVQVVSVIKDAENEVWQLTALTFAEHANQLAPIIEVLTELENLSMRLLSRVTIAQDDLRTRTDVSADYRVPYEALYRACRVIDDVHGIAISLREGLGRLQADQVTEKEHGSVAAFQRPDLSVVHSEQGGIVEDHLFHIPVLAEAGAGMPIPAAGDDVEYLPLPGQYARKGDAFAVKVRGDSMAGDGVIDGDYVVVAHDSAAGDGEMVLVRIENLDASEVVVRRLWHEGAAIRLESSNPGFAPIILGPDDAPVVLGTVIAVIRRLASGYTHRDDAFAVKVRGDSMAGDDVIDGDYVVVVRGSEMRDGEMAVVRAGAPDASEVVVRRLWHEGAAIRLDSSNPGFAPIVLGPGRRAGY